LPEISDRLNKSMHEEKEEKEEKRINISNWDKH